MAFGFPMRILIFQHLPVEHPGVFLDFWRAAGHEWHVVEFDAGAPIPALDSFDLLTVMGGPMDVWEVDRYPWLAPEKAAIRRWVKDLARPYIGICLGHQLLADALGGRVTLMPQPEVGIGRVTLTREGIAAPVFAGLTTEIETVQWHGAEVSAPPEGAAILAASELCAVQAMRWGAHAYGLQFHMEITRSTMADWAAIPEYKASLAAALGSDKAEALAGDVNAKLPDFNAAALRVNQNLMALIGSHPR